MSVDSASSFQLPWSHAGWCHTGKATWHVLWASHSVPQDGEMDDNCLVGVLHKAVHTPSFREGLYGVLAQGQDREWRYSRLQKLQIVRLTLLREKPRRDFPVLILVWGLRRIILCLFRLNGNQVTVGTASWIMRDTALPPTVCAHILTQGL